MVSVINGLFPALTAPTMLFQQEAPRNFISYKELKIFHIFSFILIADVANEKPMEMRFSASQ